MSRLIKFRGKHKLDGKWVVGNLVKMFGEWCIQDPTDENNVYVVDRKTVDQYTEIVGWDSVEIYERDIVFYPDNGAAVVKSENGCYWLNGHILGHLCRDKLEVVGNSHDNPELLEG